MVKQVLCPVCRKSVEWSQDNPYRPFCSERCKMIDLGEWAAEKRFIPGEAAPAKIDDSEGWE